MYNLMFTIESYYKITKAITYNGGLSYINIIIEIIYNSN